MAFTIHTNLAEAMPRPSPFWRGILQVPSYALPLCYWGWTRNYWNTQSELRKYVQLLFELDTVRRQIWGNDHLSCGFGLWWSHLALKWKSGQVKVGFLWEQSQVLSCQFQPNGSTKMRSISNLLSQMRGGGGGGGAFYSKSACVHAF